MEQEGTRKNIACFKPMFGLPFGIIALLLMTYAKRNVEWADQVYSQKIYPITSYMVGFLPSLVRFSVIEWLVVFFMIFLIVFIIFNLRKIIKNKTHRLLNSYRFLMYLLSIASIVYFLFIITSGLNYYRQTFTYYTGYTLDEHEDKEIEKLALSLVENLEKTRGALDKENPYIKITNQQFDQYTDNAVKSMKKLSKQYPILEQNFYSKPKPIVSSPFFSKAGIAGIFSPFTFEANINIDVPTYMIPVFMTHELSHQAGFMREDEANFIAYLACKNSDNPVQQYSGYLLAFNETMAVLRKTNPDKASEIKANLSKKIKKDREHYQDYLRAQDGIIQTVSTEMNDIYLKSNNQADGVESYGRMVELLLAEQKENKTKI